MTRVPQSTRQILNTIQQLEDLQVTLRKRVKGTNPSESLKLRAVSLKVADLIGQLDTIAGKITIRNGASVQDVKEHLAAESEKRRAGQIRAAEPCDNVVKSAVQADLKGCMVALYPSPEVARRIAVKGGEPPDRLHLTVVYFKEKAADRGDWDKAAAVVAKVAEHCKPMHGTLAGTGRFVNDAGEVALAEVDLPGLDRLHETLVEALEKAGFPISKDHAFHPHVTLKYNKADEEFPDTDLLTESFPMDVAEIKMVQGDKVLGSYVFGQAKAA